MKKAFILFLIHLSIFTKSKVQAGIEKEIINFSIQESLELKEYNESINEAKINTDLISAKFLPKLNSMLAIGPIDEERGNAVNVNDGENGWGLAFLSEIKLTYPIYTWSRKDDLLKAAESFIEVKKNDFDMKKQKLRLDIKEVYYGFLYSKALKKLINNSIDDLEEILTKEKLKRLDKLKLKIAKNYLLEQLETITENYLKSQEGLKFFLNSNKEKLSKLNKVKLKENLRELKSLEYFYNKSIDVKPELLKLNNAIDAKTHYLSSQKKERLPVVALQTGYKFSKTNLRDDQDSNYAYDPYNQNQFYGGIGITFDYDFGVINSKINQTKSQINQLKAKNNFALRGIKTLIINSMTEIQKEKNKILILKKSKKLSKKLFRKSLMGYSMGLVDSKDLIEAYKTNIMNGKNYLKSLYDYNIKWSHFSNLIGIEVDPNFI